VPNHRVSWHARTHVYACTCSRTCEPVKAPLDARETEIYQQAGVAGGGGREVTGA